MASAVPVVGRPKHGNYPFDGVIVAGVYYACPVNPALPTVDIYAVHARVLPVHIEPDIPYTDTAGRAGLIDLIAVSPLLQANGVANLTYQFLSALYL